MPVTSRELHQWMKLLLEKAAQPVSACALRSTPTAPSPPMTPWLYAANQLIALFQPLATVTLAEGSSGQEPEPSR